MKKFSLKIDGQTIGNVGSFSINETKTIAGNYGIVDAHANKIVLSKAEFFKSLVSSTWLSKPIELEFETDDYIWEAHRSWISSISYYESPEEPHVIMGDLKFSCEILNVLHKNTTLPSISTEPDLLMINKFAAAVSSYYKAKK